MKTLRAGRPFPIIDTRSFDTPRERGEAYGRQAKRQIAESLMTYSNLFATCGTDWPEACRRAMAYRECVAGTDPDFIEELDGIASGADVHFEEILALNCRTEILPASLFDNSKRKFPKPIPAINALDASQEKGGIDVLRKMLDQGECTAVAVAPKSSADGHCWLAQNWDWLGRQRQALVVLHTVDSRGAAIVTLTEAGMLAKIGLNALGMAVGLNILRSVDDGARPGVPVHVLLRHALSFDSLSAFAKRLEEIAQGPGFGAGSNIPSADATGDVACFELSPAGWAEFPAQDGVVVHTNHFLCDSLATRQANLDATLSTESRLRCAASHAAPRRLSVSSIESLLRDESDGVTSICRHPDPSLPAEARLESVAGIRIDCTARRWWIAPGIPSEVTFDEVPTGFH
jgi:isopenicillin-N N-acyltransferase-like protein